jgi:uncharacterized protein YbbK (DUF523 family)
VPIAELRKLFLNGDAIPVCPEMLGGLPAPRESCEIIKTENGKIKVISKSGADKTAEFTKGAEIAAGICQAAGAKKAILKSKSPSCGSGIIYDGSFTRTIVSGNGVCAQALIDMGVEVFDENNWNK